MGGGHVTLTKKAQEIPGAEDKFSLGYIGTAAGLVLPLCNAILEGGGRHFMTAPPPPWPSGADNCIVAHVYHTSDYAELPDIAAYAYQDVHV